MAVAIRFLCAIKRRRQRASPNPMGQFVRSWSRVAAWIALALLLVIALPLFVRMPVWIDASLYDLAARNVLHGGVHYRDLFDTNLPGMLWMHLAVRGLFGWTTEALRVVDILLFGISVYFLARFVRGARSVSEGDSDPLAYASSSVLPSWFAVVAFLFYFSTTEWCHCQRDLWLLPFALAALQLRCAQTIALKDGSLSLRQLALRGIGEGVCWGAALWIKPFVVVPAVACWLLSALVARSTHLSMKRQLLADAGYLILGGALAGAPGIAWLMASGAWPYMWDILLNWNPEYVRATDPLWYRAKLALTLLWPWSCLNIVAVPLAVWIIIRGVLRNRASPGTGAEAAEARPSSQVLLAGFYLGWAFQAVVLQKSFGYHLAPLIPLALAMIAGSLWLRLVPLLRLGLMLGFLAWAFFYHPLHNTHRLALWPSCWRGGDDPALRNQLELLPLERYSVDWVQLERVREFLERQGVSGHDVTCYHTTTHPLYLQSDLEPTTPYLHYEMVLSNFPAHREVIRASLDTCGHRYVVSDLEAYALKLQPADLAEKSALGDRTLPRRFPSNWQDVFPWNEPIVFRAGRYVVHRVTGPVVRLLPDNVHGRIDQATEGK